MACSGVAVYCTGAAQLQQRSPLGEEAFKSMEGNFTWRLEASQRRVFVQEQQCECTGAAQLRLRCLCRSVFFLETEGQSQASASTVCRHNSICEASSKLLSIYGLCVATTTYRVTAAGNTSLPMASNLCRPAWGCLGAAFVVCETLYGRGNAGADGA